MSGPQEASSQRLDSWKEIAGYLKRDVRTVQRWEQNEGLPVHRLEHGSRASVFAERAEIDAWLENRRINEPETAPAGGSRRRRLLLWIAGLGVLAAGAGLAWRFDRTPEPGVIQVRKLLRRDDVDGTGMPSWDGRFVPYRTIDAQMFLLEVATGKSRPVIKPPAEGAYVTFAASPDGSHVAYDLEMKDGPSQIRVVDMNSSRDRMVFTDPKYAITNPRSWSPDGKYLAAMLWKGERARDLAVVNVKTGAIRVLYSSPGTPGNPQFSPDGRYIAFNEKGDVLVVPAAGGAATAAVSHPARDNIVGWAPDGRLVFISDRSGKTDLYAVKLRDGRPENEPEVLRENMLGGILNTTRQGNLIYSQGLLVPEIYRAGLDAAGNLVSGPAPLAGVRFEGQNREPDYSHDGRELAYISGPADSSDTRIRIRTLATGAERALPLPIPQIDQLRWYPDGKALLLRGKDAENHYGFFRLEIEPVKFTPLLTQGVPGHAAVNATFSPDGKYLYYLGLPSPDVQVLMGLDLASAKVTEIYRPSGRFLRMFALSGDGKQLALQERENHPDKTFRDRLFVRPITGGAPRMVDDTVQAARAFGALNWAADGKSIWFERPDDAALQRDDLLRVSLAGTPPQLLVKTDIMHRIAVQPDGTAIAWQANGRVWEVSSIENLFPAGRSPLF